MNILFTRFPLESVYRGGAEHQTRWLMEGLQSRGHSLALLGSCHPLKRHATELGIQTHDLWIGHPPVSLVTVFRFFFSRPTMQAKLIRAVGRLHAEKKIDAIFMLSLTEKLLLTEWAHAQGIRVLWIEHDRVGRWLTANPWKRELRRLSNTVFTVGVSELSRQKYIQLGFHPERVIAIPNGVPLPHPPPPSPRVEPHHLRLGCVSRLAPEKGIDVLLSSLDGLPEVDLTIIGTGPEEAYLRSLIARDTERVGTSRVSLLSHTPDLETFFASIDALVLPSTDHDPFGLVVAEAMMRGVPTITTTATGIHTYLVHERTSLIVEAGSEACLRGAIRSLMNPEMRAMLAKEGRVAAEKLFSIQTMVERYEQCLQM